MTLDPKKNVAPAAVRRVHLMGVCGTGMGALAGMLQRAGYAVSGSDSNVYPPMSDFLRDQGISVREGYRPENLEPRPDLVVVGNVIRRDNPEALALAGAAIPYLSFPQALGHFFIGDRVSLVVCGTHGKTTTSSMLASVLASAGCEPSFMIGGIVQAFGRNFNVNDGPLFVAEGDEYDTAFFDKGPKFLHYRPKVAVITSIEFDHADIYHDLDAVVASFGKLVAILPADGLLVANLDDPVVARVAAAAACPVAGYGQGQERMWRLAAVAPVGDGTTSFEVYRNGAPYGTFVQRMGGRHNCMNATAVLAVLDHLGLAPATVAPGLAAFAGVRRRQEVRGEVAGVTVIDDFAHHPTAVAETLAALRSLYPGRRLVTVFEPRTNSSRRRVFQDAYAGAFDDGDLVLIREPLPLAGVAADEMFSAAELVAALRLRGRPAAAFADTDAILAHLAAELRPGDVAAILSNGGFDDIHARLLRLLAERPRSPSPAE
ncbi:MAG: UDP-N-acetylmuramate:L-alanyl-gamma-D-glutamyl-meso-diaminopimelate ligase [Thermodesulfobacteriota bacterium]